MNDDKLQKVIQEEMSKILKPADSVQKDLDNRNRNDRLQPNDKQGSRWYKNQENGNVRDQLRQIVAEEYETLRDEPDTSIEHRSGLRDFEVPEGKSGRWYTDDRGNVDTEKIEEAAKLLTKKVLVEKKLDEVRSTPATSERNELIDRIMPVVSRMDDTRVRQELLSFGFERFADILKYIDRHHQLLDEPIPQSKFNRSEVQDKLVDFAERYMMVMGKDEFMREFLSAVSMDQLRAFADQLRV
jgi:hypothetical protein